MMLHSCWTVNLETLLFYIIKNLQYRIKKRRKVNPINANIRDFGARGDGKNKDTQPVQEAIDYCYAKGGGTVLCPAGEYLIGSIYLRSGINLHLENGSKLLASSERTDYNPEWGTVQTPMDNRDPENCFSNIACEHLISARGESNVSITGMGTIDGRSALFYDEKKPGGKYYSAGHWRPFRLLAFNRCSNVLFRDISILNTPAWALWPLGCDTVNILGIKIHNDPAGPNTDGIDIDCSRNVVVNGCHISAGDDCIALKSDINLLENQPVGTENVVVSNCHLSSTCNAIRIGYEADGAIRNCLFENITITNTRTGINMLVPYHPEAGIINGPLIENIMFRQMIMETSLPFFIWRGEESGESSGINNVSFRDFIVTGVRGSYIGGAIERPLQRLRFSNIDLTLSGEMDEKFANGAPYPYNVWGYFQTRGLPHAFYCRYLRDIEFRNMRIRWHKASGEWRNPFCCEHVEDLKIEEVVTENRPPSAEDLPLARLD